MCIELYVQTCFHKVTGERPRSFLYNAKRKLRSDVPSIRYGTVTGLQLDQSYF
jgi:hypothetical protein